MSQGRGQKAAPPGLPGVQGEGGRAALHEGHDQEGFGGVFYLLAAKCRSLILCGTILHYVALLRYILHYTYRNMGGELEVQSWLVKSYN